MVGFRPANMRLLHVSDIHFKHPDCTVGFDADAIYRAALIRDVEEQCAGAKPVSAIFITGDIAFKGIKEEYDAAKIWIDELVRKSGCPDKRVYIVPGNHDINQKVIRERVAVRNAITGIFHAEDRERYLRETFLDKETRQLLFAPLAEYNAFATNFDSQVYPRERLHWETYIDWDGRTRLKVHGLTTTLLSGARLPEPDRLRDLYVGPHQTQLLPEDDVLNVVLGHHPPDWCSDCDSLDEALYNRAVLHYFGHKHRARPDRGHSFVRFYGGAVNPERGENGWEPGYSITDLGIEYKPDGSKLLYVAAHVRRWQSNPPRFTPTQDTDGSMTLNKEITIPSRLPHTPALAAQRHGAPPTAGANGEQDEQPLETRGAAMDEPTRELFIKFFQAPRSKKTRIIQTYGLAEGLPEDMPDHERYRRALVRAAELGLLETLDRELSE